MDLEARLTKAQSKARCNAIVSWIGGDQSRYDQLVRLYFEGDPVMTQRAAWPLSVVIETYPHLIRKHLARLVRFVQQPGHHEAVKRNTVRVLQFTEIPEKLHGEVMNLCFDYIADPAEKPAVKAFSLTVLEKLAQTYPDIRQELKTVIEDRWDHESPAFRSRAGKILNKINSQLSKG